MSKSVKIKKKFLQPEFFLSKKSNHNPKTHPCLTQFDCAISHPPLSATYRPNSSLSPPTTTLYCFPPHIPAVHSALHSRSHTGSHSQCLEGRHRATLFHICGAFSASTAASERQKKNKSTSNEFNHITET